MSQRDLGDFRTRSPAVQHAASCVPQVTACRRACGDEVPLGEKEGLLEPLAVAERTAVICRATGALRRFSEICARWRRANINIVAIARRSSERFI